MNKRIIGGRDQQAVGKLICKYDKESYDNHTLVTHLARITLQNLVNSDASASRYDFSLFLVILMTLHSTYGYLLLHPSPS